MHTRESLSGLVVRFFLLATTLLALAGGIAASIPRWPQVVGSPGLNVPPIFALSTVCLAVGSLTLIRAEFAVAREKQPTFRHSLIAALVAGTVFVTVQTYALGNFLAEQRTTPSGRGLATFVTVAAGLHGLHFLVAWLFLTFVTLQAYSDRYDHEYHWGVTVCAWFWHALGIVWLAVLAAFLIAGWGFVEDGSMPDLNVGNADGARSASEGSLLKSLACASGSIIINLASPGEGCDDSVVAGVPVSAGFLIPELNARPAEAGTPTGLPMLPLPLYAGAPVDRRTILVAGTSALGVAAPAMRAVASPRGKIAKSTIMIWLSGGVSHIDTWDMKPDAPAEYRGTFQPIATSAADIQVCEHLPHLAREAHHLALIRSAGQYGRGVNDHHSGYFHYLTGHPTGPVFPNSRTPLPDDWPFVGSVVAAKRPPHPGLPSVLWLPALPEHPRPGTIAAKIGVQYDPVVVSGSHAKPTEFKSPCLTLEGDVTVDRLTNRHALLKAIDLAEREVAEKARLRNYDELQTKALSLLTSTESKRAFNLSEEPEAVRNRYGNHLNATSMLMARRLVEAGVPFITVNWHDDYEEDKKRGCLGGSWDTHWKNFSCLKDYLLPRFDQPFAALLADLSERGLLDETLIVVTSEMGRTPKLGDPRSGGVGAAEPGRDHWTFCQTVLMAGGGVRGGQVYGSSDKLGGYPADKPVGPEHVIHTIYHAMGIDDLSAVDQQNRPYHLLDEGEPLTALF